MKKLFWRPALFAGVALAFSTLSGFAQSTNLQLYGVTFLGNQLITIDPTTGQGTLTGGFGANVAPYGIATYSNQVYSFSPTLNKIVTFNVLTGVRSNIFDIGVSNLQGEGDLAIRSDGVGFLASALDTNGNPVNAFYTFNITNHTSSYIGSNSVALDALAFDTNNVLYALGQDDTNLYIVNTTNAALTVVGPLGVALASPYAGMTFGPDGTLFAAINDQLYIINKTNGAATAISTNVLDLGFSSVSGLAFAPVPTPISFFNGEFNLGGDVYYLAADTNHIFGFYSLLSFPYVYHFDLGFEYFIDANNGDHGAYFYDFTSGTFFYSSPSLFPYIYDFSLSTWLYYYPDTTKPGHGTTNPRYFYNFNTSQIITK